MKDDWIREALVKFEGPLTRYAYRVTRDLEIAREVVQDVFVRLWQEDPEELTPRLAEWLFTVTRNRAIDLRRRDRRMVPLSVESAEALVSEEPSPDESISRAQNVNRTLELLAGLPGREQEVLRLKFQNGLTYEEISRVTGMSVSNVGVTIHTGMKKMRAAMQAAAKGVSHD